MMYVIGYATFFVSEVNMYCFSNISEFFTKNSNCVTVEVLKDGMIQMNVSFSRVGCIRKLFPFSAEKKSYTLEHCSGQGKISLIRKIIHAHKLNKKYKLKKTTIFSSTTVKTIIQFISSFRVVKIKILSKRNKKN